MTVPQAFTPPTVTIEKICLIFMWENQSDSSKAESQFDKNLKKQQEMSLDQQAMEGLNPSDSNSRDPNGVVQMSSNNNPLIKSTADIEKVVSQKCKTHPQKNADLLYLKSNVPNPRICISCVQQNGIQTQEYLQIKDVLLGQSNSDLFTYPVLNDPQLRMAIQPNSNIVDFDKDLVDQFYQELLKQTQAKIETRQQTKEPKILQLGDIQQRSKACWSEILDIDQLKLILYQENNEQELGQFINTHIANSDSNTRKLRELCDSFTAIQSQFSMERPNQINNSISSLLDQINFFDKNNPYPLSLSIGQSGESRNELQLKQEEVDQLQQQLRACKSQMQEQSRNQLKKISELNLILKGIIFLACIIALSLVTFQNDKKKSSRLEQQLEYEKNQSLSSNNQQQPNLNECVAFYSTDLLPTTNLLLSNWMDSKKLFVGKNNNQELEFFHNNTRQKKYIPGLSYLDFILDPLANYVVQVKFEQTVGQDKYFGFGLIKDSKKDATTLAKGDIIAYYEQNDQGDINTVIKGQQIRYDDNSYEKRSLEIRINIQRRIIKVSSLPNYDSIAQADNPELINPSTPYRFYIGGLNQKTKITITKLETVSNFDNQM